MDSSDVLSAISVRLNDATHQRPPMLGREPEFKKLTKVWERVSSQGGDEQDRNASEIVTVHGPSGVGKSYLIESFRSVVESGNTNQGIYVSSKFDQLAFKRSSRREPFYAIVSAFSDICEILKAQENVSDLGSKLRSVVGAEFGILCQFIPTFHQLSDSGDEEHVLGAPEAKEFRWDTNKDTSLSRIGWSLKNFLDVAASREPIFLHFDDIHWADVDSLTLIQSLVTDVNSRSVLIALSYRDGVGSSKVVRDGLRFSRRKKVTFEEDAAPNLTATGASFGTNQVTDLRLCNLRKEGVQKLISLQLWLDRLKAVAGRSPSLDGTSQEDKDPFVEQGNELVNVVYAKTAGNPFFVLQFLERLKLDGLLRYSSEKRGWEWGDMETITRLEVTEDVSGSINARMSQVPADVRYVLMIAAHLGFRFRRDVLETVVVEEYRAVDKDENSRALKERFGRALHSAERASLLLHVDQGESFCFVHDQVQQYAYELAGQANSRRKLYLNLGMRLIPLLRSDESLSFLVADLLNNGSDMIFEKEKRTQLVHINKTAAELSIQRAAYKSAVDYLRCAIDFLDFEDMWNGSYELTLSLHNGLALASCNCSEYELCYRTAETITRNACCGEDKHMANLAWIHAFALDGRFDEAVKKGLAALRELGVSIKAKPPKLFLFARLLQTRRSLMSKSTSYLLSLPKMVDTTKLNVLEVIAEMTASVLILSNEGLQLSEYELMMVYSLRHGWSSSTMPATAAFGLVEIAAFGNVKRATELGELALEMLSVYGNDESKCAVVWMVNTYLFPWARRPWRDCCKCLTDGFSSGLQHGKTFLALMCLAAVSPFVRLTDRLSEAERISRSNCETLKRFKVSSSMLPLLNCDLQFVLNMMGCSENPVALSGECMDEEDSLYLGSPITEVIMHVLQFELACHFGALDRAYHLVKVLEREIFRLKAFCPGMVSFWFWSGITYLDVARRHKGIGGRWQRRRAKHCLERLQKVVGDGCDDALPFCRILEAEVASHRSSLLGPKKIMEMYQSAIEASVEHGFAGCAGVACEKAYFYLERSNWRDEDSSHQYWNRMLGFYGQWDAAAKIDLLTRTYGQKHMQRELENIPNVVVRNTSQPVTAEMSEASTLVSDSL